jgi:membrane fusion protein, heavy metal efflux system
MKTTLLYKSVWIYLIVFILASCTSTNTDLVSHEDTETPGTVTLTNAQYKTAQIEYGKIEHKDLSGTIEVTGMLDVPPQNLISVSAFMGGFIKSTDLLQGMKVKKGQVIATIQNPDFIQIQTQYIENIHKLKFVELEYKRQEELSRENVSATKTFQQISSDYFSLRATIGGQEEQLKMLNINPATLTTSNIRSVLSIYAPISGYVTTVNVNIGKFVNPQDVICEIVNTEHLHAELTVFEKDISKIKVGQKIHFYLMNEVDKERTATVYLINHQISAERTIRVHAHITNEDPLLMPNMYLKAFIEIGDSNKKTVVPEKAIVQVGGKQYIFIKTDEEKHDHDEANHEDEFTFAAVEVLKGINQHGYTEVILPKDFDIENAQIVISGTYDLLAKMHNSESEGHAH